MAKNNNLKDFLTDLANAIREKKGISGIINPQDFASEIASIETKGSKWTGHADAEGLRAIGWTEEDIAYYQENGVDWNEEEDDLHKVSDENKALYGVINADNINDYKSNNLVYLPKIDTSSKTSCLDMFRACTNLVAIPMLDTSNVTSMWRMFYSCNSLTCVPNLDCSKVTSMEAMFYQCYSLIKIPNFNTSVVTNMKQMFLSCCSLQTIPNLNVSSVTTMEQMFAGCKGLRRIPQLNTSSVTTMKNMFSGCDALETILGLELNSITAFSYFVDNCYLLKHLKLNNLNSHLDLADSLRITKESLLHIIQNESASTTRTITLGSMLYNKYSSDSDIVAALANHPNISLASA